MIKSVLEEEYKRLNEMESLFRQKLSSLPKGSISIKKINGKEYVYLNYREEGRSRSRYIKQEELGKIQFQILQRKKYENALKEIQEDYKIIKRALRI
ncbi:MAG: hypothetical protein HPY50_17975 [Firmicutes bacterium]|nr:hypothetical protein [Bacillota bacterium]